MNKAKEIFWILPWGLPVLAALFVVASIFTLHFHDQIFWQRYYADVTRFGDRCQSGVGIWPGSLEAAENLSVSMNLTPMPHRGTPNPPRAYNNQFLRTECEVPLGDATRGHYALISLGQLYGTSLVEWNGRKILAVESGQFAEFPIPPDLRSDIGKLVVISHGLEDGSVGMATLKPPFLSTDYAATRRIQRWLASVYSEQTVLRIGVGSVFLFLLCLLWRFGMRHRDISWLIILAACVCVSAGMQYSLQFNLSWKPLAERLLSVVNFAAMLAQSLFLLTLSRLPHHINKIVWSGVTLTGGLMACALFGSDQLFFAWRMLIFAPTVIGVGLLIPVVMLLIRASYQKNLEPRLSKRYHSALTLGLLAAALLALQAWLDESQGIYIHYQIQLFTLVLFCGVLFRDLAFRQQQYFAERDMRLAEEQKNVRAKAIADTARFIAHDLQRPFALVSMFLERIMLVSPEDLAGVAATFQKTLASAEKDAGELINDLTAFGESSTAKRAEFSLHDAVDEAMQVALTVSPGITVANQVAQDLRIFGCRRDIVRALQNIFQNAVEAMPSSGRIKASSELLPENLCQLTLFNSDSFVPKRIRERIFDIAYTCGKPKGKGLGLAFARQVIEQHHGKIICESKEDGTSFVVLLPAIGANEPVRPLRLAIVDDDLFVHMTWSIDQPTLNICSFHDPTTFVTSMSEDPKLLLAFDVIIMDYRFRNEPPTGIDHARVLKTLPNCPPILLATQASLPETVWHNAVDAVIAKRPLSQNAVQQLLESFVPQKGDL